MTGWMTALLVTGGGYLALSQRAIASAKAAIDSSSTFTNWGSRLKLTLEVRSGIGPTENVNQLNWEVSAIVPSSNGPKMTVVGHSDIWGGNFVVATTF